MACLAFQAWARAKLTGRRLSECGLRLHFSGLGEGHFAIALPRRSSLRLMPHGMPCFSGLGEAFPYRHKSPPAHGMPCFSGLGEGHFAIALPRRSSLRLMPHGMPCFSGLGEGRFAIALCRRSSLRLMPHGMPRRDNPSHQAFGAPGALIRMMDQLAAALFRNRAESLSLSAAACFPRLTAATLSPLLCYTDCTRLNKAGDHIRPLKQDLRNPVAESVVD